MRLRIGAPALLIAILGLGACTTDPPIPPVQPEERPARPAPDPAPQSQASSLSRQLASYYERVQFGLTSRGLLRTERSPADAPFSQHQLVSNFERIALFEEYVTEENRIVAAQTESRLRKWSDPVEIQVEFGDRIPAGERRQVSAAVDGYAERLARITGHPVRTVSEGGNFHIFLVDEDARHELGPQLRRLLPGLSDAAVHAVLSLPRSSYCLAFATDPENDGTYKHAVAIVRAEHPDLLRLSCLHEEIAQGLGLANDSPQARPSIFNDDEEFALLTRHDELLLEMLYDPRMRPGMTPVEARPVAREIAAELLPGA